jgi:hypothetical protein
MRSEVVAAIIDFISINTWHIDRIILLIFKNSATAASAVTEYSSLVIIINFQKVSVFYNQFGSFKNI